jgi:hypothetical protein
LGSHPAAPIGSLASGCATASDAPNNQPSAASTACYAAAAAGTPRYAAAADPCNAASVVGEPRINSVSLVRIVIVRRGAKLVERTALIGPRQLTSTA